MNFFQKWKYLQLYKKALNQNKEILGKKFNIRIDNAYRCYTVLSFEGKEKEIIKAYGYSYLDAQIKDYVIKIQSFFKEIGLVELIGFEQVDRINENNVLIIIRYKFIDTVKLKWFELGLKVFSSMFIVALLTWFILK